MDKREGEEQARRFHVKVWKPIANFPTTCEQCLRTLKRGTYKVCDTCMESEANNRRGE